MTPTKPRPFTPEDDAQIRRCRQEGLTWQQTAKLMHRSREVVRERGRRIGAEGVSLSPVVVWTQTEIANLKRMVLAEGLSVPEAARLLHRSEQACWKKLSRSIPAPQRLAPAPRAGTAWDSVCKRPGHPITWGALTAGTMLEGVAWPGGMKAVP
jgi:hypothetical protein